MRRRSLLLLVAGSIAGCDKPVGQAQNPWLTNESAALARAKQEQRPLLVFFFADWNAAGVRLRNETFTSDGFKKAAERFVLLRLDVEDFDPEKGSLPIMAKYHVMALPTVVLIDKSGRETARVETDLSPQAFAETLGKVE